MIEQVGTAWRCSKCGKTFSRVDNAIVHDYEKHRQQLGLTVRRVKK